MGKCGESSKEKGLSEQRGLGPTWLWPSPPREENGAGCEEEGREDSDLQSSPSPQAEVPDNFDDNSAPHLSLRLQGERASLIQTPMIPFHRRGWVMAKSCLSGVESAGAWGSRAD